jgi:hypothetical protein
VIQYTGVWKCDYKYIINLWKGIVSITLWFVFLLIKSENITIEYFLILFLQTRVYIKRILSLIIWLKVEFIMRKERVFWLEEWGYASSSHSPCTFLFGLWSGMVWSLTTSSLTS